MLTYHPIYDPYHCINRLLTIGYAIGDESLLIEKIRLIDFFYLFPKQLSLITLPRGFTKLRGAVNSLPQQYENLTNKVRTFAELKEIQDVAFQILLSKGLLDYDLFKQDLFKQVSDGITNDLHKMLEKKLKSLNWVSLLIKLMIETDMYGTNGIKDRTGLGEYRYDRKF